ncbi:MAG: hydrogenase maturation protease [Methanobacteriota archaeon]|nr:MAG: hydrogenase maturation protease [Euryarchaeota archaeon]
MHKLRHTPGDPEEALTKAIEEVIGNGPVYVLGLGYVDKADDGAGVLVANALKKAFPDRSFSEHDGLEGIVLDISEKPCPGTVLFVDVGNIGEAPGSIEVVTMDEIKETEVSTHKVPVALMAAVLERSGKRVAAVLIHPKSLEFRGDLSSEVSKAIDVVVASVSIIMESRKVT